MTKAEFINSIAEKSGLSKADLDKALKATVDTIVEAVAAGDRLSIQGLGTFSQSERNARTGRNPHTGEVIEIAAAKVPHFSASSTFKAAVKGMADAE